MATAYTDGSNWGDTYTVDAWGNLTNKTPMQGKVTGENLQQTANVHNQFVGFSYDASGNLLADATSTYAYDAENRVKKAAGMGYIYDGNGERVRKCVLDGNGNCTPTGTLYWGGSSKDALDESDGSGNLTSEYVFFNGKRVARRVVATGAVYYYFADHLGSSNVITDAGGARQAESDFYPYGGEYVILADATANHYKFTGKERDTETGVDYFFARYYSSALGRFLTPDWSATPAPVPYARLADPQSLNLYSYVGNNPITGIDPDGHLIARFETGYSSGDEVLTSSQDNELVDSDYLASEHTFGSGPGEPAPAAQSQTPQAPQAQQPSATAVDRTAIAALDKINPQSIEESAEYSADLYESKNASIGSTQPARFPGAEVAQYSSPGPDPSAVPKGTKYMGDLHTHGSGHVVIKGREAETDPEHFSPDDRKGSWAASRKVGRVCPGYLETPSGQIKRFTPSNIKGMVPGTGTVSVWNRETETWGPE